MFQIQPLPFIFRACSSRSFDSPENSGVGRNNPSLMVNLHSNPELVGSRLDQRQAPGARCCGGAARPWESLTPTLGRLKSLAHLAVVSAWPTLPQHHPKPVQAQPGSLALLVTRVRVRGRSHDPPRLQRAKPAGPAPGAPPPQRGPQQPSTRSPGCQHTRDGTLRRAAPGPDNGVALGFLSVPSFLRLFCRENPAPQHAETEPHRPARACLLTYPPS